MSFTFPLSGGDCISFHEIHERSKIPFMEIHHFTMLNMDIALSQGTFVCSRGALSRLSASEGKKLLIKTNTADDLDARIIAVYD